MAGLLVGEHLRLARLVFVGVRAAERERRGDVVAIAAHRELAGADQRRVVGPLQQRERALRRAAERDEQRRERGGRQRPRQSAQRTRVRLERLARMQAVCTSSAARSKALPRSRSSSPR